MAFDDMNDEQLAHGVFQAERDLVTLQFQHAMNQLENTTKIGTVRKQIARLRTEARRRELDQGMAKDSLINGHSKTFAGSQGGGESNEEGGGFLSGIVDKLTAKD